MSSGIDACLEVTAISTYLNDVFDFRVVALKKPLPATKRIGDARAEEVKSVAIPPAYTIACAVLDPT